MSKKWRIFIKRGKDLEGLAARTICVDEKNRILLIKRAPGSETGAGKWDIPGGHVDEDDSSLEAAAQRELFEETNIFYPESDLIYVGRNDWKGDKVYYYAFPYNRDKILLLPNPESGFVEHTNYEWATIDQIKEYEKQELTTFPIYLLRMALEKVQK
jgi:8-oxo-dGTP pyrophosphatase MutT (NUDIX family)